MRNKAFILSGLIVGIAIAGLGIAHISFAAPAPNDFALLVTPSPIVASIKPGAETTLELKIQNKGTGTEDLKIGTNRFSVDSAGQVKIDDSQPSEIASWIRFESPHFTIKPGQWFTQRIRITLPKDTGFTYSLALVISRATDPDLKTATGRLLKGSLAVFTLINVERPGATRKLEIEDFSTTANIYEYLPTSINIKFKNSGNTIIQPYGNIFIQRNSDDKTPLMTLPVNDKKGYILPGSERTLNAQWLDGFPVYQTTVGADGTENKKEVWDWSQISHFRIGLYTAKVVAVYNDGQRDVPIEREVTFWVLPWKIMLAALVIVAILLLGVWVILRKIWSLIRRGKTRATKPQ
jgi:hypothetical protein